MTKTTTKTVLITGVSSGIGQATAALLAGRGFQVFGTTRSHDLTPPVPGVTMIRLDVTDDAAVQEGVQSVLKQAGHLDGLINNAGYMLIGGLEETSMAEAREQFDANVFGPLRMINAVLPAMRARRRGRIVNIASVLGFLPGPYMGIYTASKHAIEGLTETLDHEVRQFGVRAVLVEPSFTRSNLGNNGKVAATSIDAYAAPRARAEASIRRAIEGGSHPKAVADVVYEALTAASPRLRYPVGEGVLFKQLRRFVPASMFDKNIRKRYRLDG
jgi:NAD(P)-dependent dehydrogenase (short-subunit alcohol dehydrogenase family)